MYTATHWYSPQLKMQLPQTSCTCQWRLCTTFNSTGVQAPSIQMQWPVGWRGKWPTQADLVNGKTIPTWCFQSRQSITSYCQIPELCLCLTLWCLAWPTAYIQWQNITLHETALKLQCSADHTVHSIPARKSYTHQNSRTISSQCKRSAKQPTHYYTLHHGIWHFSNWAVPRHPETCLFQQYPPRERPPPLSFCNLGSPSQPCLANSKQTHCLLQHHIQHAWSNGFL